MGTYERKNLFPLRTLITGSNMISAVEFVKKKHALTFQKRQILLDVLQTRAILYVLNHFSPNYTLNHTITYARHFIYS